MVPVPGALDLREDDLSGPEVRALIREHLEFAARTSPRESRHALDVDDLRGPGVTFWTVWDGAALAGCGALLELDAHHGEIKSMRTAGEHLRKGVATRILEHILAEARSRSYTRLSLETGAQAAFAPARALYARFGFDYCGPFAAYAPDPNSVFMTRTV